ncbi:MULTISPECIES: LytTR family DNA-binding domain-containing protein [Alteromonadaceae]|uniref:LytTR family DNA-binding domain-containing protein n=1 Tax=Brumicola blandensis TaxID=3075611 RepID=A0AAW8R891_9ALTE|nr:MULTISPECIES: LytTR family DNA-binding domain-containing protein [unclassified Alteromonas]MDT0583408.1 LytTR family DNA-binding domain-containing protein [Alteromonas sp. W409]MDT0629339.1 LytTR family DNA-binding domain-containing protein [Alteromonas sp. W364]
MRIAIVDDSRLARLELKQQVLAIGNVEVVAEAANVQDALEILRHNTIDLLLLDIDLPDGDGFDILEQCQEMPQVIFVTAFNEHAIKSFEYNALDYLLKPVRQERLEKALSKVRVQKETLSPEKRIFIKDRDECYFVSVDEIFAFEALGNYTKVYFDKASPCVHRPISAIHERLDHDLFFKASRSWLVNTHFIESIDAMENGSLQVALKNGLKVIISKRQTSEFKRLWAL